MSSAQQKLNFTQGSGYRIYHNVVDSQTCKTVFGQFTLELCFFVFREYAYNLIQQYGLETPALIGDRERRMRLGISDSVIRRNGNSRESKVLKKSGKTTLYASPCVRDGVKRNFAVRGILSEMYGTEKLAYTQGLDPVIYKAHGSFDAAPVLDCKISEPLRGATSLTNPFHYTSFVCVADGSLQNDGSHPMDEGSESDSTEEGNELSQSREPTLRILENFDVHFENIRGLVSKTGPCPLEKSKKDEEITDLSELNLEGLNAQLLKIHQANQTSTTENFKPLKWKPIFLREGDFIVFDCRLPYSTGKVKGTAVMLVPISLRPVSAEWYSSIQHHRLQEGITKGKIGNWSKRSVKGCNLDEITWRNTETVLVKARIENCTSLNGFSPADRLIFGLDRYAL